LTSESLNDRADRARLATATLLMALGLDDIDIAMETAKNAVENNFVPLIAAASVAWEIYAVTHEEELAQTKESIINYVAEKTGFSREMVENTFNGLTFLTSVRPTKIGGKVVSKISAQVGKKIGKTVTKKIVTTTLGSDIEKNALVGKVKKPNKSVKTNVEPVKPYEVGSYSDLYNRSKGDGLDIHHAPQKHPAKQVIEGYDPKNAPSISLSVKEHKKIPNLKGEYSGKPRDLLAKTVKDLRNYTKTPNSNILELIKENKKQYPNLDKN
jgi:hypothetical protein